MLGTGAATAIGLIGFERVSGMDFGPDGVLYATAERADGSDTPVLITIDPVTGAGTEVGPIGIPNTRAVPGLTFRADGTLYAYQRLIGSPFAQLITINTATGAGTVVGPTTIGTAFGHALSFDPLDQLFQSFGPLLVTLNPANGAFTAFFVGMSPFPVGAAVNGMDFAGDGTLFAILDLTGGSGPADLITIDPVTGLVTDLGPTANDMDALAVAPGHIETVLVEVPTSAPDGSTHTNCVDYTVTHSSFAAGTKDIQACHIATVESAPIVEFTKTYELVDDANDNGLAEEGDVIRYTLTIGNTGNEDIEFLEIVDLIEGGLDLGAGGNLVAGPFDCQDSSGTENQLRSWVASGGNDRPPDRLRRDGCGRVRRTWTASSCVARPSRIRPSMRVSRPVACPSTVKPQRGPQYRTARWGDLPNGLYHIDPFGNPDIGRRDEQRNIVGYQHTVCLDDDEGLDIFGNPIEGAINADTDGVNDIDLDSVFPLNADDDKRWRIDTVAGSADLRGVNLHTMDIDGDSIFEECISWYSGNPGEQDVTIIDEEGEIIADWADGSTTAGDNVTTDCDLSDTGPVILGTISGPGDFSSIQGTDDCESIGPATPLVKEWNRSSRGGHVEHDTEGARLPWSERAPAEVEDAGGRLVERSPVTDRDRQPDRRQARRGKEGIKVVRKFDVGGVAGGERVVNDGEFERDRAAGNDGVVGELLDQRRTADDHEGVGGREALDRLISADDAGDETGGVGVDSFGRVDDDVQSEVDHARFRGIEAGAGEREPRRRVFGRGDAVEERYEEGRPPTGVGQPARSRWDHVVEHVFESDVVEGFCRAGVGDG